MKAAWWSLGGREWQWENVAQGGGIVPGTSCVNGELAGMAQATSAAMAFAAKLQVSFVNDLVSALV